MGETLSSRDVDSPRCTIPVISSCGYHDRLEDVDKETRNIWVIVSKKGNKADILAFRVKLKATEDEGPRIYREACRDTYVMNKEAQLCFKLYSKKLNWPSARAICHRDGAELISLNTEKKLQVFKSYILKEEARTGDKDIEYFLGGYLDITHRVWRWMEDYSIVKDYKYKSKEDRCLEFQSDPDHFGFDDTNCVSQFQPFVCEIQV